MKVSFKKFTDSNRPQIEEMFWALPREDPGEKPRTKEAIDALFSHLRQASDVELFVAECDGKLAGYALLVMCFSFEFGGYLGMIDELYISPLFRNQGIGKAFISFLEKRAKEKLCVAMFLVVTEENKKVEKIYKKLQYTALARTEFIKPLSSSPG